VAAALRPPPPVRPRRLALALQPRGRLAGACAGLEAARVGDVVERVRDVREGRVTARRTLSRLQGPALARGAVQAQLGALLRLQPGRQGLHRLPAGGRGGRRAGGPPRRADAPPPGARRAFRREVRRQRLLPLRRLRADGDAARRRAALARHPRPRRQAHPGRARLGGRQARMGHRPFPRLPPAREEIEFSNASREIFPRLPRARAEGQGRGLSGRPPRGGRAAALPAEGGAQARRGRLGRPRRREGGAARGARHLGARRRRRRRPAPLLLVRDGRQLLPRHRVHRRREPAQPAGEARAEDARPGRAPLRRAARRNLPTAARSGLGLEGLQAREPPRDAGRGLAADRLRGGVPGRRARPSLLGDARLHPARVGRAEPADVRVGRPLRARRDALPAVDGEGARGGRPAPRREAQGRRPGRSGRDRHAAARARPGLAPDGGRGLSGVEVGAAGSGPACAARVSAEGS
jgi:hypothetical protein